MLLCDLDRYLRALLAIDQLARTDNSLNGIQVENQSGNADRVACAVDACLESFQRAAEWHADVLFVHHGLFWGHDRAVTGSQYQRLKFLLDNDLALYAAHLPLDQHPEVGNNAAMCAALNLKDIEPFGMYRGVKIGYKGVLPAAASLDAIMDTLSIDRSQCAAIFPFGNEKISTVGIVSGGATEEIYQAVDEKLDLYITGEASHAIYHYCLEEKINIISGGHYQTEVWGVSKVAEQIAADGLAETTFIDIPTGL